MPYIKSENYQRAAVAPAKPGELNFAITLKIINYINGDGVDLEGPVSDLVQQYIERVGMSYTNANAVIGVLECAGRELQRRTRHTETIAERTVSAVKTLQNVASVVYDYTLAPYEDQKIVENGDVYPASFL